MDKAPSALIFTNVRGGLLPSGNVADRCLPATKALAHSLREASRPLWGMETFPSLGDDSALSRKRSMSEWRGGSVRKC